MTRPVTPVTSTAAPAAIGPYSQAVVAYPQVYVSGQLPINPETGAFDGDDAGIQAMRSIDNIEAILAEIGLGLHDVVKTTVFLADMTDFEVVNEIYARRFNGPVLPARSAFQVAALPKGARIEIEAVAQLRATAH